MRTKAYRGLAMEGPVARWYTAKARRELDDTRALARRLAERLGGAGTVLEVAPGPGHLAIEVARLGSYAISGLDISATFVAIARNHAARAGVAIDFLRGDAAHMPFAAGTFDLVVCRAALQNFREPGRALAEMRRVLKVGGTALVIELRKDVASATLDARVRKASGGALDWLVQQLIYRLLLVKRAYSRDRLQSLAFESGFRGVEICEDPMFVEVWLRNDVATRPRSG